MMYSQAIFSLYNPLEFLSFYVNVCIYHISINTSSLFLTSKYSTKSNFLIMPSILFMIFYQQEKAILNKKSRWFFRRFSYHHYYIIFHVFHSSLLIMHVMAAILYWVHFYFRNFQFHCHFFVILYIAYTRCVCCLYISSSTSTRTRSLLSCRRCCDDDTSKKKFLVKGMVCNILVII